MKTKTFFLIAALAAAVAINAQQISVVAPNGITHIYTDLNLAIQGAETGSTVYLSGGGFQVNDTTKIKKKLTIIGIGHRPDNDNADGNTSVSGNFWFEGGSDNSSVMGLFLSGDVNIGTADNAVNNFLLRYCNINSVQVKNGNCQAIIINQNYLRNISTCGNAPLTVSNNIMCGVNSMNGGIIEHNIILNNSASSYCYMYYMINNSQIRNNINFYHNCGSYITQCNNTLFTNNMVVNGFSSLSFGENCYQSSLEDAFDETVFNISPNCNYSLKAGCAGKGKATDGTDIGIYGGTGFSPTALPPIPRITDKRGIAEQTDENGYLKIQIQVKAQ